MIKIVLSKRSVVPGLTGLFVIILIGLTTYQLFELRGLRARVHTLEYAQGDDQTYFEDQSYTNDKIDYITVSKTTKDVRVENTTNYKEGEDGETTYDTQKMYVYKIKITNNTSFPYDFVEGEVRGKTKSGTLVTPTSFYLIHPDDRQGKESFGLAPGGSAETYIYIPAEEEIIELYFNSMNGL